MNIVLYQPEIPPNTGNIIRLCANTGARLHLIGPMGFSLDESRVRRAGLDYRELANVSQYVNWKQFCTEQAAMKLWSVSTRGTTRYTEARFEQDDGLLFGPETRGLPESVRQQTAPRVIRIPMQPDSRSLNLSNSVAIILYEALRQTGFADLD